MSGSSRDISPHSQAGKVLSSLRLRPMSNIELVSELSIAHPPASVRDLRRSGIEIQTREHPHPSKPGEKIKRYHLMSER